MTPSTPPKYRDRLYLTIAIAASAVVIVIQLLVIYSRRQIHPVQGTKQRQQIQPRRFQPRAEVGRNLDWGTAGHCPRMALCPPEVNGKR